MYYTRLQLCGENMLTAEGPLWQFHRKITVRSFNSKNNSLAFTESQEQAKAMVLPWSKARSERRESITVDDLETSVTKLALHIISAAGFGHQMQWHGQETQKATFAESLKTFVDEIWLLMILPKWFLKFSPLAHLRRVHKAPDIFANHVQQAINETRSEDNTQRKNDLLSNMINSDSISHGSDKGGLSDPEITSNVFIFTPAGHETTATTIQMALVLLAVHPELEQEIHEELDVIYEKSQKAKHSFTNEICYGLDAGNPPRIPFNLWYPQMDQRQTSDCALQRPTVRYAPDISILLDVVAVHRNSRYWGVDAHVFRPSRWLMDERYEPRTNSVSHLKHHANMLCPWKGAFVVFSDGHRDCPGKGFAEAELCAVVATLLKEYLIELVPPEGSTPSDAVWSTRCQTRGKLWTTGEI